MSRKHNSSPLVPVSGNSVAKSPPASRKPATGASTMNRRFGMLDDEPTENATYELPDAHSSDSSYDLRILQEMQQQREAQYAQRRRHQKSAEATPGRTPGRFTPGISQRIVSYQPRNIGQSAHVYSDEETETEILPQRPMQPYSNSPALTRYLRQSTIERGPEVTITKPVRRTPEINEAFLQAAEESPLSRKSSARGTPATIQPRRTASASKSDSWDLTADLNDQLGFTSTPAPSRRGPLLHSGGESDGDDETGDLSLPLDTLRLKLETSFERKRNTPKASDVKEKELHFPPLKALALEYAGLENRKGNTPKASDAKGKESLHALLKSTRSEYAGLGIPSSQPAKTTDSQDVLKRLARSVSSTPSPKLENAPSFPKRSDSSLPYSRRLSTSKPDDSESKFVSALDTPPLSSSYMLGTSPKKSPKANRSLERDTVTTKPARTSEHRQNPSRSNVGPLFIPETPRANETVPPVPSKVKFESPAPEIELPQTSKQTSNSTRHTTNRPSEGSQPAKPALPKSAISSIVQRGKSHAPTADPLGDATMNSLEDIMEVTSDDNVTDTINTLDITLPEGILQNEEQAAMAQLLEHRLASDLPFADGLPTSMEEQRLIREIVEQRLARTMKSQMKQQLKSRGESKAKDTPAGQDLLKEPAAAAATFKQDKVKVKEEERSEPKPKPKPGRGWPSFSILTPRKKSRMEEELHLQRMSDQLHTVESRQREVSADMSRLKRKYATPTACKACGGTTAEHRRGCTAAATVEASREEQHVAAWKPLLWRGDAQGQRHLTWLGWMLLVPALWALVEGALVFLRCAPLYAALVDNNYGPFIDGARPPFMLATTVCDPVAWMLDGSALGWGAAGARFAWRFLWHLWDGEDGGGAYDATESWAERATGTVVGFATAVGGEHGAGAWDVDEVF